MKYPKINTLWKREKNKPHNIIPGEFSMDEFKSIKYWLITEKIDGTNIRIVWNGKYVVFCGRNNDSQIPSELLNHLIHTYPKEFFLKHFPGYDDMILYGEGYGKGIQKRGKLYSDEQKFILFDVKVDEWWLEYRNVLDIAVKCHIPLAGHFGICSKLWTVEDIERTVKIRPFYSGIYMNKIHPIEGIVARSYPQMLFRKTKTPIMFKLKVRDYERLEKKLT